MTARENFIKKQSLILLIISVVGGLLGCIALSYFQEGCIDFKNLLFCILAAIGIGEILILLAAFLFPNHFVDGFDENLENVEPDYYFFYEDYDKGLCRVIRYYGKVENGNTDVESFSKSVNFIDRTGNYLFEEWFPYAYALNERRVVVQGNDNLFYLVSTETKDVIGKGVYKISSGESNGLIKVMDDEFKVNFLDIETGNFVWDTWKIETLHINDE